MELSDNKFITNVGVCTRCGVFVDGNATTCNACAIRVNRALIAAALDKRDYTAVLNLIAEVGGPDMALHDDNNKNVQQTAWDEPRVRQRVQELRAGGNSDADILVGLVEEGALGKEQPTVEKIDHLNNIIKQSRTESETTYAPLSKPEIEGSGVVQQPLRRKRYINKKKKAQMQPAMADMPQQGMPMPGQEHGVAAPQESLNTEQVAPDAANDRPTISESLAELENSLSTIQKAVSDIKSGIGAGETTIDGIPVEPASDESGPIPSTMTPGSVGTVPELTTSKVAAGPDDDEDVIDDDDILSDDDIVDPSDFDDFEDEDVEDKYKNVDWRSLQRLELQRAEDRKKRQKLTSPDDDDSGDVLPGVRDPFNINKRIVDIDRGHKPRTFVMKDTPGAKQHKPKPPGMGGWLDLETGEWVPHEKAEEELSLGERSLQEMFKGDKSKVDEWVAKSLEAQNRINEAIERLREELADEAVRLLGLGLPYSQVEKSINRKIVEYNKKYFELMSDQDKELLNINNPKFIYRMSVPRIQEAMRAREEVREAHRKHQLAKMLHDIRREQYYTYLEKTKGPAEAERARKMYESRGKHELTDRDLEFIDRYYKEYNNDELVKRSILDALRNEYMLKLDNPDDVARFSKLPNSQLPKEIIDEYNTLVKGKNVRELEEVLRGLVSELGEARAEARKKRNIERSTVKSVDVPAGSEYENDPVMSKIVENLRTIRFNKNITPEEAAELVTPTNWSDEDKKIVLDLARKIVRRDTGGVTDESSGRDESGGGKGGASGPYEALLEDKYSIIDSQDISEAEKRWRKRELSKKLRQLPPWVVNELVDKKVVRSGDPVYIVYERVPDENDNLVEVDVGEVSTDESGNPVINAYNAKDQDRLDSRYNVVIGANGKPEIRPKSSDAVDSSGKPYAGIRAVHNTREVYVPKPIYKPSVWKSLNPFAREEYIKVFGTPGSAIDDEAFIPPAADRPSPQGGEGAPGGQTAVPQAQLPESQTGAPSPGVKKPTEIDLYTQPVPDFWTEKPNIGPVIINKSVLDKLTQDIINETYGSKFKGLSVFDENAARELAERRLRLIERLRNDERAKERQEYIDKIYNEKSKIQSQMDRLIAKGRQKSDEYVRLWNKMQTLDSKLNYIEDRDRRQLVINNVKDEIEKLNEFINSIESRADKGLTRGDERALENAYTILEDRKKYLDKLRLNSSANPSWYDKLLTGMAMWEHRAVTDPAFANDKEKMHESLARTVGPVLAEEVQIPPPQFFVRGPESDKYRHLYTIGYEGPGDALDRKIVMQELGLDEIIDENSDSPERRKSIVKDPYASIALRLIRGKAPLSERAKEIFYKDKVRLLDILPADIVGMIERAGGPYHIKDAMPYEELLHWARILEEFARRAKAGYRKVMNLERAKRNEGVGKFVRLPREPKPQWGVAPPKDNRKLPVNIGDPVLQKNISKPLRPFGPSIRKKKGSTIDKFAKLADIISSVEGMTGRTIDVASVTDFMMTDHNRDYETPLYNKILLASNDDKVFKMVSAAVVDYISSSNMPLTPENKPMIYVAAVKRSKRLVDYINKVAQALKMPKINSGGDDAVKLDKMDDVAANDEFMLARPSHLPMEVTGMELHGKLTKLTIAWDTDHDAAKMMNDNALKHAIKSFVKGLESTKEFKDLGFLGSIEFDEFDPEAGVAVVYFNTAKGADALPRVLLN
jgi:hypothetical protein